MQRTEADGAVDWQATDVGGQLGCSLSSGRSFRRTHELLRASGPNVAKAPVYHFHSVLIYEP